MLPDLVEKTQSEGDDEGQLGPPATIQGRRQHQADESILGEVGQLGRVEDGSLIGEMEECPPDDPGQAGRPQGLGQGASPSAHLPGQDAKAGGREQAEADGDEPLAPREAGVATLGMQGIRRPGPVEEGRHQVQAEAVPEGRGGPQHQRGPEQGPGEGRRGGGGPGGSVSSHKRQTRDIG